jgi:hypothetical protein
VKISKRTWTIESSTSSMLGELQKWLCDQQLEHVDRHVSRVGAAANSAVGVSPDMGGGSLTKLAEPSTGSVDHLGVDS